MNVTKNSHSLYDLVKPDEVRVEDLGDEQPVLEKLQKILIGAAANSGGIIGIWKPALDTYNTLFPNLFGLPNLIFKKVVDKSMIGFAAYVASKTVRYSHLFFCTEKRTQES